jgi:outer membrane lipoprotein LolB
MVAIRMTWVISILLLSLHCLLAGADDRIEVKTPVEVLSETLASLNLANPTADLEANLSKGDRRFIGINGYTCTTPGANNEEYSLVHSAQYGLRCLAGTSDNIESEHHKVLIEEATDYARKYNTELLRRIHTGKI